jgi:hypothetical protein
MAIPAYANRPAYIGTEFTEPADEFTREGTCIGIGTTTRTCRALATPIQLCCQIPGDQLAAWPEPEPVAPFNLLTLLFA